MRLFYFLIFLLSLLLQSPVAYTQTYRQVQGGVIDSAKQTIASANVMVVQDKDTLMAKTDTKGRFSFTKVRGDKIKLIISHIGYKTLVSEVKLGHSTSVQLDDLVMEMANNELEEIVVKSKVNPIRIAQDTVEYNAAAYDVKEGDNVADLLKQFSGLEVDEAYNVTVMGKSVVKLRVNGEDFFTGDVNEFIAKLPAEIVSKIQIVDDFGDQANFTGIKTGEPTKLINIETKSGMNKGKFGDVSSNVGTNNQIGGRGHVNLWNGRKQTGVSANYITQDNGAGFSVNRGVSGNFRNKFREKGNVGFQYGFNQGTNAYENERYVETVSSIGVYNNATQSRGDRDNSNHNVRANLSNVNEKWYYNGTFTFGYRNNANVNSSVNNQSGVIHQGFRNVSDNESRSPNIGVDMAITRKLTNSKHMLSGNFSFSNNAQESFRSIHTNTLYYSQDDQTLIKDSVLNRNIDNTTHTQRLSFGTNYTFTIGQANNNNQKRLSLNYRFALDNTRQISATSVLDNTANTYYFVDTLSSDLKSLMINQTLGMDYHQTTAKNRLSVGLNIRPVVFRNDYLNFGHSIYNNAFNYSPTINLNRTIAKGKILTVNYSGNNNSPTPHQLQPVPNTQNLQNIIIGNPDLRPFFQHRLSSNFNYVHEETGRAVLLASNLSTTRNEIVNNVIIIPDTLGSYRQETRFANTNGTYQVGSNYMFTIPLKKNKFSIGYGGSVGLSNKALFIDNERYFNTGLNYDQFVSGRVNIKKFSMNTRISYAQVNNNDVVGLSAMAGTDVMGEMNMVFNSGQFTTNNFFRTKTFSTNLNARYVADKWNMSGNTSYSFSANENTSVEQLQRNLQTLLVSLNGNFRVIKSYNIDFSAAKRMNIGYAIANQNPFLVGIGISKMMLKNKGFRITARANDLLNQGNMLSRQISGNSIVDTRNTIVTRVFTFGLSYNLSRFGPHGQHIRVDPD
ncbi:MAG TPA: outer membrane beta-barrel protein [Sphingobacterium sp.]|nr:outer membrane beta-barrel protein [Sphingobacterium sp.]